MENMIKTQDGGTYIKTYVSIIKKNMTKATVSLPVPVFSLFLF